MSHRLCLKARAAALLLMCLALAACGGGSEADDEPTAAEICAIGAQQLPSDMQAKPKTPCRSRSL